MANWANDKCRCGVSTPGTPLEKVVCVVCGEECCKACRPIADKPCKRCIMKKMQQARGGAAA